MAYGNLVALFDILGFEQKLASIGLAEMLARYEALIDIVNYRKEQIKLVFDERGYSEAPYWSKEGDVSIFNKTRGAYASDSILLWSESAWPAARGRSLEECKKLDSDAANGWAYLPIPCDNFLDVCNDLICRSLEVGLPLRGGISMGEAVLDQEKNIFLGQPIVEAARLEKGQRLIGASFCKSAINQTIPKRFALQFDQHIKNDYKSGWGGVVLDWPRHWRRTRSIDLVNVIKGMDTDHQFSDIYKNTLDFISHSHEFAGQFESIEETSIRSVYDAFSWSNDKLSIRARAVRRVKIENDI
jgi:hypothetical protein